jgi:hypothetical protein
MIEHRIRIVIPSLHNRPLQTLAWVNALLHGAGLLFVALCMRPGTPAAELSARIAYLQEHPLGWSVGWCVWMLCVPTLVSFLILTARQLPEHATLPRLAFIIAVAGAGFDLFCDAAYIVVLPHVAGQQNPALFQTVEKLLAIGSLFVANGFYSAATLLMTLALRERGGLQHCTVPVGYGVAGFGFALAAAAFTGWPWHVEWTAGLTIGLFCTWVLLVAYSLEVGEQVP